MRLLNLIADPTGGNGLFIYEFVNERLRLIPFKKYERMEVSGKYELKKISIVEKQNVGQ